MIELPPRRSRKAIRDEVDLVVLMAVMPEGEFTWAERAEEWANDHGKINSDTLRMRWRRHRETRSRRGCSGAEEGTDPKEAASHEAGHAVEAFLGGAPGKNYRSLGLHAAILDPPLVKTTMQERLRSEGIDLSEPPRPLTEKLIQFYQGDIRVRLAGPLAQFGFHHHVGFDIPPVGCMRSTCRIGAAPRI